MLRVMRQREFLEVAPAGTDTTSAEARAVSQIHVLSLRGGRVTVVSAETARDHLAVSLIMLTLAK